MTESNLNWQSKIRFFSKFLGYQNEDLQNTNDESMRSQLLKRPFKGIQVVQGPSSIQSMILPNYLNQQNDRKWLNLIRMSYSQSSRAQLLRLTYQGTCSPNKVMPWLAQNRHKINLKVFNIKRLQYRNCLNQNNPYILQKINSEVQILTIKLAQNSLRELLGILMLFREDLQYSDTLLAIGQTVNDYLQDSPVIAFSLLYYFCCTGALLPFLTNDAESINYIINQISNQVRMNCSSATFFARDQIPIYDCIRAMIESFWFNISQSHSEFRAKILYYLLINKISLKSVSRICEATINGLSRILNQGNRQKSIQVLTFPRPFLDEEVFLNYLFFQK